MIRLLGKIPQHCELACSGGVDSMAVDSFLTQMKIQHGLLFFDHGTKTSADALKFLTDQFGSKVITGRITRTSKPKDQSWEEHWRNERNTFFKSRNTFIITGHHLDDFCETYVWSGMHGQAKLPLYYNGLIYRPFALNEKAKLVDWAIRHKVEWIDDKTNMDNKYTRNYIRNEVMPHVYHVNPGFRKVIRKKILKAYTEFQVR